jgi:hypothetical protein
MGYLPGWFDFGFGLIKACLTGTFFVFGATWLCLWGCRGFEEISEQTAKDFREFVEGYLGWLPGD